MFNVTGLSIVGSLLAVVGATSAESAPTPVPTKPAVRPQYEWITNLTEGPVDWFETREEAPIQGRAYRLVITTAEIYSHIYIETVTYGDEGCCKKLVATRLLDLDALDKAFGLKGEQAGFEFEKWLSETSLVFRYHDRDFVLTNIGQSPVQVIQSSPPR